MSKQYDKRIFFVKQVVFIKKLTNNPTLANEWYINNKAGKLDTEEAIVAFGEWMACNHEEEAERCEALDSGMGECEVAVDYHVTRASEIRAIASKEWLA